jgi:hypothetical protein
MDLPGGNDQTVPTANPNDTGNPTTLVKRYTPAAATVDRRVWRGAVNQSKTTMRAPYTDR